MQKHKHYDVIVAWAEGKPIQHRGVGDEWRDWNDSDVAPMFRTQWEYRIKPETVRCRVALFNGVYYKNSPQCANTTALALAWEKHRDFVKWITDWIEVDVP